MKTVKLVKTCFVLMGLTLMCVSCGKKDVVKDLQVNSENVSKGVVVDNVIWAEPEMMKLYDKEASYIRDSLHEEAAAAALLNIKKLFMENDYMLNTQKTVNEYYENVKVYTAFVQQQPQEVQEYLDGIE